MKNFGNLHQHNLDYEADQLYQPLRSTLDPHFYQASRNVIGATSYVSKQQIILQPEEIENIKQKIFIPIQAKLIPTKNFERIGSSRLVAINATQKVIGAPITEQQFNQIRSQKPKQQVVVYEMGEVFKKPPTPPAIKFNESKKPTRYQAKRIEQDIEKKKQYKYNLFSIIDEPMNKAIEAPHCSFDFCYIPSNEVIATKTQIKTRWF